MKLDDREDPVPWIRERVELYEQLTQLSKTVEDDDQYMATMILLPTLYLSLVTSLTTQLAEGSLHINNCVIYLHTTAKRHREVKYTKKMRPRLVQGLAANIVVVVVKVVGTVAMDVMAVRRVSRASAVEVWDNW